MNENIYDTPQSSVAPAAGGQLTKIYSPNQILAGSFWGGPIAAVYFLWKNYTALGKAEYAQNCLVFGILFMIAILVGLLFLPENVPSIVVPVAYSIGAMQLAVSTQLDKRQIAESESHSFQSSWKVFGIGALTLVLFMVLSILVLLAMESAGIVSLM